MDDLKISHVSEKVVESIVTKLQERYGKEAPLTVNRGTQHDYLGMKIDFGTKGKVIFTMDQYIDGILENSPSNKAYCPTVCIVDSNLFGDRSYQK